MRRNLANQPTDDQSHFARLPWAGKQVGDMPAQTDAYLDSSCLEKVLEHRFVAELTTCLWLAGCRDVEVLRSEVDAHGYDLVVEARGILRHIQLKSMVRGGQEAACDYQFSARGQAGGLCGLVRLRSSDARARTLSLVRYAPGSRPARSWLDDREAFQSRC